MALPVNYYDIVFVGRGYSISTYLHMADLGWRNRIAIIGGTDAWANTIRGAGIINHRNTLVSRVGAERNQGGDNMPTRGDLVNSNAAIINLVADEPHTDNINGIVKSISRETVTLGRNESIYRPVGSDDDTAVFKRKPGSEVKVYKITYLTIDNGHVGAVHDSDETVIHALKVVYGAGAGPHTPPLRNVFTGLNIANYVNNNVVTYPVDARVIDLDTFMRRCNTLANPNNLDDPPEVHVALVGPNAGIDAAIKALSVNNITLHWLIRGSENIKPAWLPTRHYQVRRNNIDYVGNGTIQLAEGRITYYRSSTTAPNNNGGPPIRITLTPNQGDNQVIDVDYYVFAIGQNPQLEERIGNEIIRIGAAKVLEPILNDEKLLPVYDTSQRYGQWFETALGLRDAHTSKYTGLEVIGAAAFGLSIRGANPPVKQDFVGSSIHGEQLEQLSLGLQPGKTNGQDIRRFENYVKDNRSGDNWNSLRENLHLLDFFSQRDRVPSVSDNFMQLIKGLNQRSVGAGDQLGTIRCQVAALTGYDVIAAHSSGLELLAATETLRSTLHEQQIRLQDDGQKENARDIIIEKYEAFKTLLNLFNLNGFNQSFASSPEHFHETVELSRQSLLRIRTRRRFSVQEGDILIKPDIAAMIADIPNAKSQLSYLFAELQQIVAHSGVDYNGMDRTELAVFLAARYPKIASENWSPIIDEIIAGRRNTPGGYNQAGITDIKRQLELINGDSRKLNTFSAP